METFKPTFEGVCTYKPELVTRENAGIVAMLERLFVALENETGYELRIEKVKFKHPGSPLPSNFFTWKLINPVSQQVFCSYDITRNIFPKSDKSPKAHEMRSFILDCMAQIKRGA